MKLKCLESSEGSEGKQHPLLSTEASPNGSKDCRTIRLNASNNFSIPIGRASLRRGAVARHDNGWIRNKYVSATHGRLFIKNDRLYYEDCDSSHGSTVDSQTVNTAKGPMELDSDRCHTIVLGSVKHKGRVILELNYRKDSTQDQKNWDEQDEQDAPVDESGHISPSVDDNALSSGPDTPSEYENEVEVSVTIGGDAGSKTDETKIPDAQESEDKSHKAKAQEDPAENKAADNADKLHINSILNPRPIGKTLFDDDNGDDSADIWNTTASPFKISGNQTRPSDTNSPLQPISRIIESFGVQDDKDNSSSPLLANSHNPDRDANGSDARPESAVDESDDDTPLCKARRASVKLPESDNEDQPQDESGEKPSNLDKPNDGLAQATNPEEPIESQESEEDMGSFFGDRPNFWPATFQEPNDDSDDSEDSEDSDYSDSSEDSERRDSEDSLDSLDHSSDSSESDGESDESESDKEPDPKAPQKSTTVPRGLEVVVLDSDSEGEFPQCLGKRKREASDDSIAPSSDVRPTPRKRLRSLGTNLMIFTTGMLLGGVGTIAALIATGD